MSVNRRTTDWQRTPSLFLAIALFLTAISGCGPGEQSDLVQVNSVPVSLNITTPQSVTASSTPRNSFWATFQRWLSPTEAWAANLSDIVALVVEVTGPGIPSPIKVTEPITGATGGQSIPIVLDVPVGQDRVFTVSALNAANVRIFQGQSTRITLSPGEGATADIQIADIAIRITTTSLPGGTVGIAYSATGQAERVNGAVGWAIIQGQLPSGLTLNGSTGVIAGTPATVGTFNFTVRATDSSALFDDQELSIVIAAQLTITTTGLRSGTVGAGYSEPLQTAGAIGVVNWRLATGSIPLGLNISQAGVISGIPTTAGTSTFTVRATDTAGRTDDQNLSITINPSPTITTAQLPRGFVGSEYNVTEGGSGFQLEASGGVSPYTWSIVEGQLPPLLSFSSAGVISGTPRCSPNSNLRFETFSATYRVQDNNNVIGEKQLSLEIQCFFDPPG